ncbi:MAG: FecR family protein, partial [Campylobacterota bacterium]|nr:FecR family protein [Campylobacterota bacterium]
MKFLIKIIIMVLFLASVTFGKEVATVTALKGDATLERDSATLVVNLGDKLQEKDAITTGDKSKVQIIFDDETIVTIGKNSNFSINEYLFEEKQEPVVRFGMLKGAMRTITGKIGKIAPDKFSVETKSATIGIRGTNFAVLVGEDGSNEIYCTFGAISVSINGAEHIINQGFFIEISALGVVEVREFTPTQLKKMQKDNFADSGSKNPDAKQNFGVDTTGQLDTTIDKVGIVVIKDATQETRDATQIAAAEEEAARIASAEEAARIAAAEEVARIAAAEEAARIAAAEEAARIAAAEEAARIAAEEEAARIAAAEEAARIAAAEEAARIAAEEEAARIAAEEEAARIAAAEEAARIAAEEEAARIAAEEEAARIAAVREAARIAAAKEAARIAAEEEAAEEEAARIAAEEEAA